MEISKLTNIMDMLKSVDVENKVMALHIINSITEDDLITIMYFYKMGFTDRSAWKENAPDAYKLLNKYTKVEEKWNISWDEMFRTVRIETPSKEMLQFILDAFTFTLADCIDVAPENISIILKTKEDE